MAFTNNADLPMQEILARNIDDIDLILRYLLELLVVPKAQRIALHTSSDQIVQLVELLQLKEATLKKNLEAAEAHIERQKVIGKLEMEVKRRDADIAKLHQCLKDAENTLTNGIFQANQKLKSINAANHRKVSADDLIRFAHRISSSNSVAAPDNWQQGDPRRPYPTDKEMRCGMLSRFNASILGMGGSMDSLMQAASSSTNLLLSDMGSAGPSRLGRQLSGPSLREDLGRSYIQQQNFHGHVAGGPFPGGVGPGMMSSYSQPNTPPVHGGVPHQIFHQPGQSIHQMLPFGSPMGGHHGSAPSTPTQSLGGPGGWSPRASFPMSNVQFSGGHMSPRFRVQHHGFPGSMPGPSGPGGQVPMVSALMGGMPMQGGVGHGPQGSFPVGAQSGTFVAPSSGGPMAAQSRTSPMVHMGFSGPSAPACMQHQHLSPVLRQQLSCPPSGVRTSLTPPSSMVPQQPIVNFVQSTPAPTVKMEASAPPIEPVEVLSSDSSDSSSDETP